MSPVDIIYKGLTAFLLLLILAACQSTPVDTAVEPEAAASESDVDKVADTVIAQPSPYEQNQPSVSRDAKERFNKALIAMQAADWETAKNELLGLAQDYPALSGPLLNLGIVAEQQADVDAAEKYYQQTISVNPTNMAAYHRYGVMLREQGRFQDAEVVYLDALKIWPDDASSHKNLGILYDLYMGRLEEALGHYQTYLAFP